MKLATLIVLSVLLSVGVASRASGPRGWHLRAATMTEEVSVAKRAADRGKANKGTRLGTGDKGDDKAPTCGARSIPIVPLPASSDTPPADLTDFERGLHDFALTRGRKLPYRRYRTCEAELDTDKDKERRRCDHLLKRLDLRFLFKQFGAEGPIDPCSPWNPMDDKVVADAYLRWLFMELFDLKHAWWWGVDVADRHGDPKTFEQTSKVFQALADIMVEHFSINQYRSPYFDSLPVLSKIEAFEQMAGIIEDDLRHDCTPEARAKTIAGYVTEYMSQPRARELRLTLGGGWTLSHVQKQIARAEYNRAPETEPSKAARLLLKAALRAMGCPSGVLDELRPRKRRRA